MTRDIGRFADWLDQAKDDKAPELLSDNVVAECFDPQNMERLASFDVKAILTGPCGDTMEIYLLLDEEPISQASFMTDGCGATVACGNMLTKMVKGLSLQDAAALEPSQLRDALGGLPPDHGHCATRSVLAMRKAIEERAPNG